MSDERVRLGLGMLNHQCTAGVVRLEMADVDMHFFGGPLLFTLLAVASASGAVEVESPAVALLTAQNECVERRPCWPDLELDIAIIGVAKSGTSSLLRLLGEQHPQVACSPSKPGPNASFICHEEASFTGDPEVIRTFAQRLHQVRVGDGGSPKLTLVKQPNVLFRPLALARLALLPRVRVIVCIREPISWLVSYRNYRVLTAWEKGVPNSRRGATDCPPGHTSSNPPSLSDFAVGCKWLGYNRERARLAPFLSTLLERVPAERVFVIGLEARMRNPQRTLEVLTRWLGISSFDPSSFVQHGSAPHRTRSDRLQSWCKDVSLTLRAQTRALFVPWYEETQQMVASRLPHSSVLSPDDFSSASATFGADPIASSSATSPSSHRPRTMLPVFSCRDGDDDATKVHPIALPKPSSGEIFGLLRFCVGISSVVFLVVTCACLAWDACWIAFGQSSCRMKT